MIRYSGTDMRLGEIEARRKYGFKQASGAFLYSARSSPAPGLDLLWDL